MSAKRLTEEQKELYNDLSTVFNDTVVSIEMVCFEGETALFNALNLRLPAGRKNLWAILVYGESGLHIYVNPMETTILGFRVGGQKKDLKEQFFSFANFDSWKVEPILKNTVFGKRADKFRLLLQVKYSSEDNKTTAGMFVLETQMNANDTLKKMSGYLQ